jgi:two-component system CheB/CheR fusion protein
MTSSPAAGFPIVGIGASAGGIEALEGFFRGLPNKPGLAFVIVTHLSPERESVLHEVVARYTDLAVHVAGDGALVEINRVYVLPADAILNIEQGHLLIRRPARSRRERKPIDIFFSSLAADQGELAVGVVLSGGDGDGTLGIKAIKERGGLTLAQVRDGYGPQYPEMPDSAISTGFVDFAVPADAMGVRLVEFARSLSFLDGMASSSRAADEKALNAVRQDICAILRNQVGHDFSGYKIKTFMRRVQRRMQIRQCDTIDDYVELLRHEPQEVGALFRDLLINVTNFFRDADAFELLATLVVPKLFEGRGADDTIRIWVPGCATGEEVFSIGMLLREHMDQLTALPRVQIFATDIDERALSVARSGRYPSGLLDSVSPERRERFFVSDGGSYMVGREVRDLCIFSPHSVIRDPPFSRIDLVSCRNLLIYFGLDVQNQVIPIFHYALRPDGYLFLGTSENISQFGELFAPIEKKHRIFRKRRDASLGIHLPLTVRGLGSGHVTEHHTRKAALSGMAFRQAVESQVLEQFAPPHVVVNRDGDVVFYSPRTGKYLEAAAGAPTRQIVAVARKGLRLDLRTALREAVETGHPVTRDSISVEAEDGRVQMITLIIAPMNDHPGGEPLFLVLFADQGPTLSREEALRPYATQDGAALQLERELRDARERLQSMIEEYETALEELKSSNEELVSVNEELQSTNEELEASKEELQSVNEELHTVNADLTIKIEALDRANGDLQNLFDSTDIATVFLDRDLMIRNFTPAVAAVFNILPGDRGRPITDLSSRFSLPDLTKDIAGILAGQEPIERRVEQDDHKAHYLLRLGPYRNGERQTEGVVVTFTNVTTLTRAEAHQRVLIAELQHRTRNLLTMIQSIAVQTLCKDVLLDSFASRLAALGRVQSLVSDAIDDTVDLAEILRLELQVHGADQSERVTLGGPPVSLSLEEVQIFALVLHELATNAVKYGALKQEAGRLAVIWTVENGAENQPHLILGWRESDVSMPFEVSRRGFGRKLIEQALTFTLRARTNLTFGSDGVSCRIEMPLGSRSTAIPGDQQ